MLKVYLAGEIHTNWREEIIENCKKENLDIQFSSPVTDHPSSDDCGVEILGDEEKNFWKDRKGANINSIRTKKSIKDSDVVVVKFGEKYKQWNAAAFHCLYFSPNLTTTTSLSLIDFLVLIELILAPFLSFQKFFSSSPNISTPQSSDDG